MRYKNKRLLSKLWLEDYLGEDGLCLLCFQNNGIVQTRDGQKYCICPNGRTKKALANKQ